MLNHAKSAHSGFDVISLGAATVDILVKSAGFKLENNLLCLPQSSKNEIQNSLICSGGGATNSCISFTRLGLNATCVALIGSDPLSEYIEYDLEAESVPATHLIESSKDTTDYSIILVGSDGCRTILTHRGDTRLEEKQISWHLLKNTRWFYLTSLEGNLDLLEKLIGFAKDNEIKVAFNPGNRELAQPKLLKTLIPHVDFLLLNKTESEGLLNLEAADPQFWPKLISLGAPISAVTNGRDGAYVVTLTEQLYSPIQNVKPVDETGAGDAFGSTFVAAQIHGLSLTDSLSWAIRNSASAVSKLGAKPGLLTLKEIKK